MKNAVGKECCTLEFYRVRTSTVRVDNALYVMFHVNALKPVASNVLFNNA